MCNQKRNNARNDNNFVLTEKQIRKEVDKMLEDLIYWLLNNDKHGKVGSFFYTALALIILLVVLVIGLALFFLLFYGSKSLFNALVGNLR